MRLRRLDLLKYGAFTDQTLTFNGDRFGLHIVYGPNEAGKSTTLRAIRHLLFGIPGEKSCPDAFLHSHSQLRLGAEIEDQHGQAIEFVRRPGGKNSLRTANDQSPLEATALESLLQHLDEDRFCSQFGISYDELKQGGQSILSGGGDLGTSLFAAGSGVADLVRVLNALQSECDELFRPSASKPRINAALKRLQELEKETRRAQLSASDWKQHVDNLEAARSRRTDIGQKLAAAQTEADRLRRLDQALPRVAKWKDLQQRLDRLPTGNLLREDFAEQRRTLEEQLRTATITEQNAAEEIAVIEKELQTLPASNSILESASEIDQLHSELGHYQQLLKEVPTLESEKRQAEQNAERILRDLGHTGELQEAQKLRLSTPARRTVRELIARHDGLNTTSTNARRQRDRVSKQLQEEQSVLDKLPPLPEARSLQDCVNRIRRLGDVEQLAAQMEHAVRQKTREAEKQLQRLPRWSGSLEALEKLSVPAADVVQSFDDDFRNSAARREAAEEKLREVEAELTRVESRLQEMALQQDVPTEDDLQQQRQRRDAAWQNLRQQLQHPKKGETGVQEKSAPSPNNDALNVYEREVLRADELADRLRREAQQVAEKSRWMASRTELKKVVPTERQRVEEATEQHRQLEDKWHELWAQSSLQPGTPREMLSWLRQYEELLKVAAEVHSDHDEAERRRREINVCRTELTAALQSTERDLPNNSLTLESMLQTADRTLDEIREASEERQRRSSQCAELRRQLMQAEADVKESEDALQKWERQWKESVESLVRNEDLSPAAAESVLDALDSLTDAADKAAQLKQQLEDRATRTAQFEADVGALVERIGLESENASTAQLVARLHGRLNKVRTDDVRRQQLLKDLNKQRQRQRESQQQIETARQSLQALCQEAGVGSVAELPEAERQSDERRDLQVQLNQLREQLQELAKGAELSDFIRQAEHEDVAGLQLRMEEQKQVLADLAEEQKQLSEQIGSLQNELSRMDGSSAAADLRLQQEEASAEVRSSSEQYIRLKLAHAVLKRAIDRYRERHQGPVLQRASRLFSQLTLGAFSGLQTDMDEKGQPILVGVRPADGRQIDVSGMSEGTCDQLYLSLRLASLELWFDEHPPVPFIVDDILIQFDDDRTVAALYALAALAERTQVIVFTHHQHLLELAETHLMTSGQLFTQRLTTPSPIERL